ncbi:NAD(P)-dependent oxidoreductase [Kineosporia sp. J2-2]|uniref:NAD(P)-dependent oxidoreductase n=1 Tax=Kineosporia corallincola TaxID=2835133 RepID=A0ABS5TB91_9ACTN|nr:NAD(P)-dependent oxidoreductase [Kineosporia corallincola]MBT0768331.1 NAD(P)-dependent oxidoreductase [Kineosporia corallincola]
MSRHLITGAAGHLGEGLARTLREQGHDVVGLDVVPGPFTTVVGSVTDGALVRELMDDVEFVLHTATLHKPHVGSHGRQDFVDVNVSGTLNVLEAAAAAGVRGVVFTSSTSTFGRALSPAPGEPAAWITEAVRPLVKNIYGATKVAAEDLCELAARDLGLPVVVLKTSRFFPEADDQDDARERFADVNLKVNEFLNRRVELSDVVSAHLLAAERAPELGFRRYVVSAPTPFGQADREMLGRDAAGLVRRLFPRLGARFDERGWQLPPVLDRVYDSSLARAELGWQPVHDFATVAERALERGEWRGDLALAVGVKGYHSTPTGVYTTVRTPGSP